MRNLRMLTCAKCHAGELKVLPRAANTRNSFEVLCLNAKCRERYALKLGLGEAITQIAAFDRARRPIMVRSREEDQDH
jgi:hypothetical protein